MKYIEGQDINQTTFLPDCIGDMMDNVKAIKNVFRAFVKVCMTLNLCQKEPLAIDGNSGR